MHRLSWIYGGPLLFLALCGSGDFGALGADLIIRNISILPGGNAQVVVAGRADSYYLLYRGEVVTDMRQPTAAEPGLAGDVTLTDPVVEPEAQAHFYRVEEVALAAPRDTDGDGMDDPFELGYRPVLNPLDPSDAASDFDGDGRTHLQEYRDRTDPMIANSPPPPATPGLAAVPDSTQGTFLTLSGNGPTNTYIRIEGGAAVATNSVSPDGTFQVNVPLSPNRLNRLLVSALNGKGEVSIGRPVEVLQDSQPPTLFLDFPGSAYAITTSNVMVAGRVGDSLSGYRGLQVWVHSAPSEGSPPLATARFPEDSPWAATVDVGIGPNGTYERGDVPLTLGTNVVTAIATDALGNRTLRRLEVVRRALEGPRLVALSGDRQITNAVRRLDQPIRVRVTQQSGTPIPDAPLLFEVTRSDGRLLPVQTNQLAADWTREPNANTHGAMRLQLRTDANGEAEVWWTLGSEAGCANNRVCVTGTGISNKVFLCASAQPHPARQLNLGSGNNQRVEAGGITPEPLRVWASDGLNPAVGIPITFRVVQGGGRIIPGGRDGSPIPVAVGNADAGAAERVIVTGVTGHASAGFIAGPEGGPNRVEASFPGQFGLPVTFVIEGLIRRADQAGSFAGLVLDNTKCPIGGAVVRLQVANVDLSTTSDSQGRFRFENVQGGMGHLYVNGATANQLLGKAIPTNSFPALTYSITTVANAENALPTPVLLPRLNPANARVYNGTEDITLTCEGIEGLKFTIQANSMRHPDGTRVTPDRPAVVSLNQVHHDDIPMPMPDGVAPPFAWTFQPGGAHFDAERPVKVEYPNMSGLAPGSIAYFLSFNHDTERFEIAASGHVTDDGATILTDPGSGLTISGWGCNCPPYSVTGKCRLCETECDQAPVLSGGRVTARSGSPGEPIEFNLVDLKIQDGSLKRTCPDEPPLFKTIGIVPMISWTIHHVESSTHLDGVGEVAVVASALPGTYVCYFNAAAKTDDELATDCLPESLSFSEAISVDCLDKHYFFPFGTPLPSNPVPGRSEVLCGNTLHPFIYKSHCEEDTKTGMAYGCVTMILRIEQYYLQGMPQSCVDLVVAHEEQHETLYKDFFMEVEQIVDLGFHGKVFADRQRCEEARKSVGLAVEQLTNEHIRQQHALETLFVRSLCTLCRARQRLNTWAFSAEGALSTNDEAGRLEIQEISAPDSFGLEGPGSAPDFISDDFVRVIGVSTQGEKNRYAFSEFFRIKQGETTFINDLTFTDQPPRKPERLEILAPSRTLRIGTANQLQVIAHYSDGFVTNVASQANWTSYRVSNTNLASISPGGLITPKQPGVLYVTAVNEGASAVCELKVGSIDDRLVTLRGQVVDSGGRPVAGAEVRLHGFSADVARTGLDGIFRFPGLPTGITGVDVLVWLANPNGGGWWASHRGLSLSNSGIVEIPPLALSPLSIVRQNTRFAMGDGHSVAIRDDGTIWTWGENVYGQLGDDRRETSSPGRVGTNSTWLATSAGGRHTVALTASGALWSWGANDLGQLGDGTIGRARGTVPVRIGTNRLWKAVSCGSEHTLAIAAEGSLWSWGDGTRGALGGGDELPSSVPREVLPGTKWSLVSAGGRGSLGIRDNGTLWVWGATRTQYGDTNSPQPMLPDLRWRSAAAGADHFVALQDDGTLWACGLNYRSQLGDGTSVDREGLIKVRTGAGIAWASVGAGSATSWALSSDGNLWAWGNVVRGALDNPTDSEEKVPTPVLKRANSAWTAAATGGDRMLALASDGTLWSMGSRVGNMGIGKADEYESTPLPVAFGLGKKWSRFGIGGGSVVALGEDGTLWSWGRNDRGQLGNGTRASRIYPGQIGSVVTAPWSSVVVGLNHAFALQADGSLWCWGANAAGVLGLGNTADRVIPTKLTANDNAWTSVSVGSLATLEGFDHAMGLRSDGTLWTWGANQAGQLGDGTKKTSSIPKQVGIDLGKRWKRVGAGYGTSFAIADDDSLWGWGAGSTIPTQTATGVGKFWADVSHGGNGGGSRTIAIATDGTMWAWGDGKNGTGRPRPSPAQIVLASDPKKTWRVVSAAATHSLALASDGTLWAWGDNFFGQLGDGTRISRDFPVPVATDGIWIGIGTADGHSMALAADGTLWGWGGASTYWSGNDLFFQLPGGAVWGPPKE